MIEYIWPISLIVLSNIFYNICAKSTPAQANPFASLMLTYLVGAAISLILFFAAKPENGLLKSIGSLNWTSIVLGISIVGLEFGYIMAYRAGWNVGTASLVANIILAVFLIFVGMLLYHETISIKQLAGIALCVAGLVLINQK